MRVILDEILGWTLLKGELDAATEKLADDALRSGGGSDGQFDEETNMANKAHANEIAKESLVKEKRSVIDATLLRWTEWWRRRVKGLAEKTKATPKTEPKDTEQTEQTEVAPKEEATKKQSQCASKAQWHGDA